MYGIDNNTSKIDALAKHTSAETYGGKCILARPYCTLWYVRGIPELKATAHKYFWYILQRLPTGIPVGTPTVPTRVGEKSLTQAKILHRIW